MSALVVGLGMSASRRYPVGVSEEKLKRTINASMTR
jgi:hypothetical protein